MLPPQRHEEPKTANDEYEQGTYVYFDYNIVHDDQQARARAHASTCRPAAAACMCCIRRALAM